MATKIENKIEKMLKRESFDINELNEYVEEHVDDFDLNDNGESSSYLYETDDEEMQEILMDWCVRRR